MRARDIPVTSSHFLRGETKKGTRRTRTVRVPFWPVRDAREPGKERGMALDELRDTVQKFHRSGPLLMGAAAEFSGLRAIRYGGGTIVKEKQLGVEDHIQKCQYQ